MRAHVMFSHSLGKNSFLRTQSFLFLLAEIHGDSENICISSLDAALHMHIPLASYSWSKREPIQGLLFRQSVEGSCKTSWFYFGSC